VTPGGASMTVCALCGDRAEALGWVRTDLLSGAPPPQPRRRRGLAALRARFARSREDGVDLARPREDGVEAAESRPEPQAEPAQALDPAPEPEPAPPPPDTPERRMRRAAERFNEGEAPRLVAGLTRSLGAPRANLRELQGPARVEITIAWELSWYRWEIGQDGGGEPRQVAKGAEMEELAADELDWNAGVDEGGRLRWPASS
jgi:hypothetical protein